MKRTLLLSALMLASLAAMAQITLRERTHGLLPGYPNPMILTTSAEAGAAGADVTWDFSGLPQQGPFMGDVVENSVSNPPASFDGVNTCLVEGDLEAFMRTSRRSLMVMGLRTGVDGMVRKYDTPLCKMRYPFSYGDMFQGEVQGTQTYPSGTNHPVYLKYEVRADAHGTLILPGSTLTNVLRVMTAHDLRYSLDPRASHVRVVTYRWYVKEHRFPVLSLIFQEMGDGRLVPLKGAYNPIVQLPERDVKPETTIAQTEGSLASVEVRPNPFSSQLTVSYEIAGSANVTIAVYNMNGALVRTLLQTREAEGTYERTFTGLQNLTSGLYIVRVEAAGRVLSQKVVKVQ